jgi:hypothetical protein
VLWKAFGMMNQGCVLTLTGKRMVKIPNRGLLFCDVRSKIRLLWLLSALSIFHRLPPTR